MGLINLNLSSNISEIVINNNKRRNSLSSELLEKFIAAINRVEKTSSRVLIIRAVSGSKVWSSGFNIEELPVPGVDPVPYNHPLEKLIRRLQEVKIPVIAMLEGSVWGGACDLAMSCDILVGTKNTTFALTPAKIGVPYNSIGIQRILNYMNPNIAKELFFTASPMSAERAFQLGLLNHIVDTKDIERFTFSLAEDISSNSPLSISVVKRQIDALSRAKPLAIDVISQIDECRNKAYNSEDYVEGKLAFQEKRTPNFQGK